MRLRHIAVLLAVCCAPWFCRSQRAVEESASLKRLASLGSGLKGPGTGDGASSVSERPSQASSTLFAAMVQRLLASLSTMSHAAICRWAGATAHGLPETAVILLHHNNSKKVGGAVDVCLTSTACVFLSVVPPCKTFMKLLWLSCWLALSAIHSRPACSANSPHHGADICLGQPSDAEDFQKRMCRQQ